MVLQYKSSIEINQLPRRWGENFEKFGCYYVKFAKLGIKYLNYR